MKTLNSIKILALTLIAVLFFSNCEKAADQSENPTQQGNITIQINAVSQVDFDIILRIRYNNVINAPINATIGFNLKDGQEKNVQITIPANNKNLKEWSKGKFINLWNYTGGYKDSTGDVSKPPIDRSWDISSVEIKAVSCPDKKYKFKILRSDDWIFYQPKDSITSVNFISNNDTLSYSDYDFIATLIQYNNRNLNYYFNFFSNKVMLFSDNKTYPLHEGMTMKIPSMVYRYNSRNYGSQSGGPKPSLNGSTVVLTITKVTDTHFDATFSGKLWSLRQPDTLHISDGQIKNAVLPEKVD